MKKIALLLVSLIYLTIAQTNKFYCLEITSYIQENINELNSDSLRQFFIAFSKDENSSNAEFSEWGNEVLFKVIEKKPELFFKVLFEMDEDVKDSVKSQIDSPVNDGIDLEKVFKIVKESSLKESLKIKAVEFLEASYKSYMKMMGKGNDS